jgi:hypothetical protein
LGVDRGSAHGPGRGILTRTGAACRVGRIAHGSGPEFARWQRSTGPSGMKPGPTHWTDRSTQKCCWNRDHTARQPRRCRLVRSVRRLAGPPRHSLPHCCRLMIVTSLLGDWIQLEEIARVPMFEPAGVGQHPRSSTARPVRPKATYRCFPEYSRRTLSPCSKSLDS